MRHLTCWGQVFAMQATTSGGAFSEINVTPMIDVILVLLIIFMVITPIVQRGTSPGSPNHALRSQ